MKARTLSRLKIICQNNLATLKEYQYFCRIIANDYESYKNIEIHINKMKSVRILRNYYALAIDVYEESDFLHCKELAAKKWSLTCIFYIEMHNSSDQRKAQQEQLNYVKEHPEYQEAYNEIYHLEGGPS